MTGVQKNSHSGPPWHAGVPSRSGRPDIRRCWCSDVECAHLLSMYQAQRTLPAKVALPIPRIELTPRDLGFTPPNRPETAAPSEIPAAQQPVPGRPSIENWIFQNRPQQMHHCCIRSNRATDEQGRRTSMLRVLGSDHRYLTVITPSTTPSH